MATAKDILEEIRNQLRKEAVEQGKSPNIAFATPMSRPQVASWERTEQARPAQAQPSQMPVTSFANPPGPRQVQWSPMTEPPAVQRAAGGSTPNLRGWEEKPAQQINQASGQTNALLGGAAPNTPAGRQMQELIQVMKEMVQSLKDLRTEMQNFEVPTGTTGPGPKSDGSFVPGGRNPLQGHTKSVSGNSSNGANSIANATKAVGTAAGIAGALGAVGALGGVAMRVGKSFFK